MTTKPLTQAFGQTLLDRLVHVATGIALNGTSKPSTSAAPSE